MEDSAPAERTSATAAATLLPSLSLCPLCLRGNPLLLLLKNRALLHRLFAGQRNPRLARSPVQNLPCHILPQRRPMLESVPRSASHKPNVLHLWVLVDQKIPVPRVFVLADARLHNRRIAQSGKSPRDVPARFFRRSF